MNIRLSYGDWLDSLQLRQDLFGDPPLADSNQNYGYDAALASAMLAMSLSSRQNHEHGNAAAARHGWWWNPVARNCVPCELRRVDLVLVNLGMVTSSLAEDIHAIRTDPRICEVHCIRWRI